MVHCIIGGFKLNFNSFLRYFSFMKFNLKISLLLLFVLTSAFVSAQDKTFAIVPRQFHAGEGTIMIVPYENKMFLSDINREVHNRTGLELSEIRRLFREGLSQVISNEAAKASYETLDILNSGMDEEVEDIDNIHQSVGYVYSQLPPPEKEKEIVKRVEKILEQESLDQQKRGVEVNQGEILTYYDGKERFMDVQILNPELFVHLNGRHSFDYVLIINELDIKVLRNHDAEMGQLWERMVKVHYNWLDGDGNKIYGGAAYYAYEGNEKDIYTIIRKSFTPIAQQMLVNLPVTETQGGETFADQAKRDNASKNQEKTSEAEPQTKKTKFFKLKSDTEGDQSEDDDY
ncbi:MAG: hypothetical protein ACI9RU_000271 [Litorivivens sp.]|jgi:hypothetical protein